MNFTENWGEGCRPQIPRFAVPKMFMFTEPQSSPSGLFRFGFDAFLVAGVNRQASQVVVGGELFPAGS
jgi:hypothetical protein